MVDAFDLKGRSVYDLVPVPDDAEVARQHLQKAILRTRSDNPSERNTEDFESFFEYTDANATEYYGGLQACVPSLNLSPKHLLAMERVMLKFSGRIDAKSNFAAMRGKIGDRMEEVLRGLWMDSVGMGRSAFVRGNLEEISLFIRRDAIVAVENALDSGEDFAF